MSQTFNAFSFVLHQLDWRHYQSLALMPNPNLDKERSQCGPRLLRYANSQREYPAQSAKEQILFPPLEGKVKTLVPRHLRQGNPGKEKHLRTCNIKIYFLNKKHGLFTTVAVLCSVFQSTKSLISNSLEYCLFSYNRTRQKIHS